MSRCHAPPLALGLALALAPLACSGGDDETRGDGSATQVTSAGLSVSASAGATATTGSLSDGASTGESAGTDSGSGDASTGVSASESGSDATSASTTAASTTDDPTTTTTSTTTTTTTTTTDGTTGGGECMTVLAATIRDFSSAHPDFETYTGDAAYTGIVETDLGDDDKPVYAHPGPTPQTTGPAEFAQWYNDVPGVNVPFPIELVLTESQPGVYTYANSAFYPIDGQGFGNEQWSHNYHFTTEIHATFTYKGGEVFTFTGDDDLWTFINGKLAIDLGGLHPQLTKSVDLDAVAGPLGIVKGATYPMDIFHAERHTDNSNFRIDTTIQCFIPQ